MKTSYQILFSIVLQHDYYNQQDSFDDIEIIPTDVSQKIMKGHRILYKVSGNNLTALIESDGEKPFINVDKDTSLRLLLKIKKSSFQNVSALKAFDLNNKIYYFTNLADNESDDTLYLSKPMTGHDNSEEYEVGSLLQDTNNIYEAIISNIASAPPNSNWRILSPKRFPEYSKDNYFEVFRGNIIKNGNKNYEALKFIPHSNFISMSNTNYWKEINSLYYVTAKDLVDIDLIKPEENVFGVIDLFFKETVPANYSILDSDGKIKEIKYVIRFKNRISTWRYIIQPNTNDTYNADDEISVLDNDKIFSFDKIDCEFISNEPIPLMAVPIQNFKFEIKEKFKAEHIKCASTIIKPEAATKSFLSEIYLNY